MKIADYAYIIFFAILPVFVMDNVGDSSLVPRQLLLSLFLVVLPFLLQPLFKKNIVFPYQAIGALGLIAVLILSIAVATNPVESYATVVRLAMPVLFFIITLQALRQKLLQKRSLIMGVALLAALSALITLFEMVGAINAGTFFEDIYTIKGTYSHKNLLSAALMLSLPFVIMGSVFLKKPWNLGSRILVFLIVLEIFVLRTRGVWLGTLAAGIGTTALFFLSRGKTSGVTFPRNFFVAGLGVAVLVLAGIFSSDKITAQVVNTANVEKRLNYWESSVKMIQDNPVLGVGAGNWKIHFPKYGLMQEDKNLRNGVTHIQRPHNDFLWMWSETGFLGAVFYISLFVLGAIQAFRNLRKFEHREDRIINWLALFGIGAYFIFSFGDFPLERSSHNILFFSLLALVFSYHQGKSLEFKAKPVVFSVVALVALIANYYRLQGQQGAVEVLEANSQRNAQKIISAVDDAVNPINNMDDYANPLRYFSSLGYLATNRPQLSLSELEAAVEIAPYNILVHKALCNTHRALGNPGKALAHVDTALRISPRYEAALKSKAGIHVQQKDYHLALRALNKHPYNSQDRQYLQLLAQSLRGTIRTKDQHEMHREMIAELESKDLREPMDYVNAYRQRVLRIRD